MKKLLFATCFILAFASCKKEKHGPPPDNPYGLPNATTEGKNIFACRVNGQNWISETGIYNMGGGIPWILFGLVEKLQGSHTMKDLSFV